jgi:ABC-type nitrate/sulfonate/bicarbonate transport system ATPase subunit
MSVLFNNPTLISLPHTTNVLNVFGEIRGGEIVALQGPSGCGKSSLLKSLAGASKDPAMYSLEGVPQNTPASEIRNYSLVFQKPLLFPHLNVIENICFPLRFKEPWKSWSHELKNSHALTFLKKLGLESLATRPITHLSGGEAMRISLVRSLISEPRFLMLDEAFAALDKSTKDILKKWLKTFIQEQSIATLMVTHLSEDIENFADRIIAWPSDNSLIRF